MKTLMMTTAAALIAAGSAYAADTLVVIDADNDGLISADEYTASMADWGDYRDPMWTALDADADGVLTADEFHTGMWTHYDVDADGFLSADELQAWDEDELRYDATRSGREISPPQ